MLNIDINLLIDQIDVRSAIEHMSFPNQGEDHEKDNMG
jgi:hypothetical protein